MNGDKFVAIIWGRVQDYFDEITQDIRADHAIISAKDYRFCIFSELEAVIKGIYAIDDVKVRGVKRKINELMEFEPVIRVVYFTVTEPCYRLKSSGRKISRESENIKNRLREKYEDHSGGRHHNIIHIGDSPEHTRHIEQLLAKDIDLPKLLSMIKKYNYALTKVDVPYMPDNFPEDYPLGKDMDVVCDEKDFKSICSKLKKYSQHYEDRYKVRHRIKKNGDFNLRFELSSAPGKKNYLCYGVHVSPHVFVERVSGGSYYVLGLVDELKIRIAEYEKNPSKTHHLDYIKGRGGLDDNS